MYSLELYYSYIKNEVKRLDCESKNSFPWTKISRNRHPRECGDPRR